VAFPAVRYLIDSTREHEKRLRLRHWLLLALRVLLVLALVLAAAGPSLPVRGVDSHPPTALAIVFDNSLSSGVVAGGSPRIESLRRAARDLLARATPADVLWLVTSDGIPRRGSPEELRAWLDTLTPAARRLDLGEAITTAAEAVGDEHLPGGVVVVTDLQATSVTPAHADLPVVVVAVTEPAVANLGTAALDLGAEPWGIGGGRVTVTVAGDRPERVPVRVQVGTRPARAALVGTMAPASVVIPGMRPGWYEVRAELDPDELRADDGRSAGVRVATVAAAEWRDAGRFAAAALETLRESGRVRNGSEVTVGGLGPHASVVFPPSEVSRVGALDRSLSDRGVTWRFGPLEEAPATTDSGAWLARHSVTRRYRLISSGSGRTGVLASVAGEPWIVRSGDVILVGSRLEPEWTDLPLRADFVTFLDALVNRVARGEVASIQGNVGEATLLPDAVTEVRRGAARWAVEGGAGFTPPEPGVYWLLVGADTMGALGVAGDPRESDLRPADPGVVAQLWKGRVVGAAEGGKAAFALAARADLRGALLGLALIVVVAELIVASWGGRGRRS
jgi:hypothetical protein